MAATAPEANRFSILPLRPRWIVLALVLTYAGWSAYRFVAEKSLFRAHASLLELLAAGDFDRAYKLTSDNYRTNHSATEFRSKFDHYQGRTDYEPARASVLSIGFASAEVYLLEAPWLGVLNGPSFFYVRENGEWRFTGETVVYLD